MKKFLFTISSLTVFCVALNAQVTMTNTPSPASPETKEQDDFDKKNRFGIRVSPQPTWLKSGNTSSKPDGATFGFGFGLVWEKKLSNIIHFTTGIGGDFEGGKISYRNDATFQVGYVMNNENELVRAENGIKPENYNVKDGNTQYVLRSREYKSTFITIPILLKMMTNEYSGLRYFAMFGGELGIRAALKANDSYYSGATANGPVGSTTLTSVTELKNTGIIIGKDGSAVPIRVGMNLGLGTEYRIAGSTSLVFSVNYFQSFTNLMRNDSRYLFKNADASTGTYNFSPLTQNYLARAVRINIAIMF